MTTRSKKILNKVTTFMVVLCFCVLGTNILAKEQEESRKLPSNRNLAAAMSDPDSRADTLLTLLAVSRMLQGSPATTADELADLEAQFRDDRAWLERLAMRYSYVTSHSTIFDPAAWFIQQELGQHALVPSLHVSPLGPEYVELLRQLFDRSNERLAAAFLPETLFQVEFLAGSMWQQLFEQAKTNGPLLKVLSKLSADWFDPWLAVEPPVAKKPNGQKQTLQKSLSDLEAIMASALLPQPPDDLGVKRLRFNVLAALPEMDENQARTGRYILRLISAVDGLNDHRYLDFIQSLLWVVTDLMDMYVRNPDADSPLPQILVEFLPNLSTAMARSFSDVDSRFNASLAATFDVVQELQNGTHSGPGFDRLRQELADTVTQLVLLLPAMDIYFDQPVRRRITKEIDICISVAAVHDDNGQPIFGRNQFDACIESMVNLADSFVRRAELAGDPQGPFAVDQLQRELEMAPWQRINYTLGFLHERSLITCPLPDKPIANPLEWSALATLMVWFSRQSPVYFQTPANEALIVRMRQQGQDLVQGISQQVDCINGSGGRFNDLISVSLQQYRGALLDLIGGIREAELTFRADRLRAGADVVLGNDVKQETAYRTTGLMIVPCDVTRVCEMDQPLEATRALVGQFPDEYLIADQTGLGDVEVCYDNMQWVQRRMEPVRPEDSSVANYFGHLSFDLVGRYREGGLEADVFGSNFVSPEEYHYLIAANSDEVLNDGCPSEWVGSRIVTTRSNNGGINIVPNRLTYLAAARSRPSDVINANWNKGAEWRDWFVTGIGVTDLEFRPDFAMRDRLGQHLRALYEAEQRAIYSNLLMPPLRTSATASTALFDLLEKVSMFKSLLRNQMILFYPEAMLDSDELRASLEGQSGLLDESVLHRFQENNVAISEIHDLGLARVEQFQSAWRRQPEAVIRSGSIAVSTAHAIARLNALYRDHFTAPSAGPAQAVPVPANSTDANVQSTVPGG